MNKIIKKDLKLVSTGNTATAISFHVSLVKIMLPSNCSLVFKRVTVNLFVFTDYVGKTVDFPGNLVFLL